MACIPLILVIVPKGFSQNFHGRFMSHSRIDELKQVFIAWDIFDHN